MKKLLVLKALSLVLLSSTISSAWAVPAGVERDKNYNAGVLLNKARGLANNLDQTRADDLLQIAFVMKGKRSIFECREVCQILCRSKFASAESYALLANTYLGGLGDENKARPIAQYLQKALNLNPRSSYANTVMALVAMEEGRFEDAIKWSDKAIACPNPVAHAFQLKASALANLGRDKDAIAVLDKTPLSRQEHEPAYYRIRGNILENLKRYNEAAESYRKALSMGERDLIKFRLVHTLELGGNIPEAIREIDKVIAHNPKDGEAYRTRAMLKMKNKDLNGAVKDYDQCLIMEPTARTFRQRAELHMQLGHKDLAAKDLAEAQKIEDRI